MKFTSNDMDHFTECYVCKSSLIKKFYINSSLSKCLKCKFVFYDQLPLENELNAIYSGYSRDSYITDASHNKVTSTLREITNSHNISSVLEFRLFPINQIRIPPITNPMPVILFWFPNINCKIIAIAMGMAPAKNPSPFHITIFYILDDSD